MRQVVEATIEETAAGRVPVIAGVGFAGGLAKRLAKQAADSGADGVLAFRRTTQTPIWMGWLITTPKSLTRVA